MNSTYSNISLLVLILACFYNIIATKSAVPAILAFGDSLLDTGNNNYLTSLTKCNFYPYGRDFVTHLPTGRFSNGRVPTDLVAEGLGIKSTVPAYRSRVLQPNDLLTGVCFASGGSGLDQLTSTIQRVIGVQEQVNDFKGYIAKLNDVTKDQNKTQSIISNALFLISAGNNDLGITYLAGRRILQYNIAAYTDLMIRWSRSFFKDLYDLGARKFAVMGTLPLGCLPPARATAAGVCSEPANFGARMFNQKLSTELGNLNAELSGARFVYIDMYNPFHNLSMNPMGSGFVTGYVPCCCTPATPLPCVDASRHVFWDYAHPTEKAYTIALAPIVQQLRSDFA